MLVVVVVADEHLTTARVPKQEVASPYEDGNPSAL